MLNADALLGIVHTEAIESSCDPGNPYANRDSSKGREKLPPIDYNLELIRLADGRLVWVDDSSPSYDVGKR